MYIEIDYGLYDLPSSMQEKVSVCHRRRCMIEIGREYIAPHQPYFCLRYQSNHDDQRLLYTHRFRMRGYNAAVLDHMRPFPTIMQVSTTPHSLDLKSVTNMVPAMLFPGCILTLRFHIC